MFGLRRFGIKLGLDTIRNILTGLDNPQDHYRCIHIAGTNGKGSVAATLASILKKHGYKVGLYTSPHLVRFNERICINDVPIPNKDVVKAYEAVKSVHHGDREPTFFEFSTAMALTTFAKEKVDWAIIETGMGGRLDATNIIKPKACVITNISLEHREYLGNTIAEIAGEKAGIIKRRVPVITGVKQKKALEIIQGIAKKNQSPLFRKGREFRFRKVPDGTFTYHGIEEKWKNLQTGLSGEFQAENAALTAAVCEVINHTEDVKIDAATIRNGLQSVKWPGRLEIAAQSPLVLMDGAHNFIAARQLAAFLKKEWQDRKITLVIGILADKPYASMLKSLLPLTSRVVLTQPSIDRALNPEKLFAVARKWQPNIKIIPDVGRAVRWAIESLPPRGAICIAGSLYVVGEAKAWFEQNFPPGANTR